LTGGFEPNSEVDEKLACFTDFEGVCTVKSGSITINPKESLTAIGKYSL
jgi:hypothetical protein